MNWYVVWDSFRAFSAITIVVGLFFRIITNLFDSKNLEAGIYTFLLIVVLSLLSGMRAAGNL